MNFIKLTGRTGIFSLFDSVADFEVESLLIFVTSLFKPMRLTELKLANVSACLRSHQATTFSFFFVTVDSTILTTSASSMIKSENRVLK